jgi:GDP-D-mannose dehydratase
MSKKNIIITGALGQDGVILSKLFLKNNFKIFGIIKKLKKNSVKGVKYIKIPMESFSKLSKTIKKINPDIFVHLGRANPSFKELKKKYDEKNYKISKNILDHFSINNKKTKIILVGSAQMYKEIGSEVNINSKFNPQNAYAKFNVKSFFYMKKMKKKFNLNVSLAILFNHDSLFRNKKFLFPRLVKMIKSNNFKNLKEIYNNNISGDFSHADDICNGIYKLCFLKSNPDKLIFSSYKRTFINDIINHLFQLMNKNFKFDKNKKKENKKKIGNNKITKKILNWKIKKNAFIAAEELI